MMHITKRRKGVEGNEKMVQTCTSLGVLNVETEERIHRTSAFRRQSQLEVLNDPDSQTPEVGWLLLSHGAHCLRHHLLIQQPLLIMCIVQVSATHGSHRQLVKASDLSESS